MRAIATAILVLVLAQAQQDILDPDMRKIAGNTTTAFFWLSVVFTIMGV